MSHEEEILQVLREMKETQEQHHRDWTAAMIRGEAVQQRASREVGKIKHLWLIPIIVLVVIVFASSYLPLIWVSSNSLPDLSDMERYANPIATPAFDGRYTLTDSSFQEFPAIAQQPRPEKRESHKQLLAILADQYENFRIDHGVITSGKVLVQEFRLISGTRTEGMLQGRAIWHEDVADPGDYSTVNVRLSLKGDALAFSFFPDGEQPVNPIILRRATP